MQVVRTSTKETAAVDWNSLDSTAVLVKEKYEKEILNKLSLPKSKLTGGLLISHNPRPRIENDPYYRPGGAPYYRPDFQDPYPGLLGDHPFSGGVDNVVGPSSGLFGVRPSSHMRPRFDPPGMGGIPDPGLYPSYPHGPRFPGPGGMGGGMFG